MFEDRVNVEYGMGCLFLYKPKLKQCFSSMILVRVSEETLQDKTSECSIRRYFYGVVIFLTAILII